MNAVAAALLGPYIVDCPQCLDVPRRFADKDARDQWARRHNATADHGVTVSTDVDAMVTLSRYLEMK